MLSIVVLSSENFCLLVPLLITSYTHRLHRYNQEVVIPLVVCSILKVTVVISCCQGRRYCTSYNNHTPQLILLMVHHYFGSIILHIFCVFVFHVNLPSLLKEHNIDINFTAENCVKTMEPIKVVFQHKYIRWKAPVNNTPNTIDYFQ